MCGFAAVLNWGSPAVLASMVAVQRHRGPDDSGVWSRRRGDSWVGLGSSRLAIQDLSEAGHMPMCDDREVLCIAYNGEVYNFPDLKADLERKGYRFRSNTDTEVLLQLYRQMGPDCVEQLDGMFAFALWDGFNDRLFVARDRFGIKPFYFIQKGNQFAAASELKALLLLPGMQAQIDIHALHRYLTFLWVPDPGTMVSGVQKLPAGHCGFVQNGALRTWSYWDMTFPPAAHEFAASPESLVDRFRELFGAAVERHMISDVPVGAFLSAGLDSTSILSVMSEVSSTTVPTYNITFPAQYRRGELTRDDPAVVREAAAHFGARHQEIVVEPDVAELLPRLLWHMDEPIADPAAIAAYLVCDAASSETTVLLSGIGGDELFAGYRKHVASRLFDLYRRIPARLRKVLEPLVLAAPSLRGSALKGYMRLAKKMARSGSLPPIDAFLMNATYFTQAQKEALYLPGVREQLREVDPWEVHKRHFDKVEGVDFLNQMLYVDVKTFMVSLNLTYNDKMSMASSMEVRVPFLDRRLAEFAAWEVPPSMKLHGRTTKYLVRRAMANRLPQSVLKASKAGFGAPADYWLANELRPLVDDTLSTDSIKRRGLFEPDMVSRLVHEQRSGAQDWSLQIWALLTLELWMRAFVDRADVSNPPPRGLVPIVKETINLK